MKSFLTSIDAYKAIESHLMRRTNSGAIISLSGVILMIVLGMNELREYINPPLVRQMAVDGTQNELMTVRLDMTFPRVPCSVLSVDAFDQSGKNDQDVRGELHKERISELGISLGAYDKAGGGVSDEEDLLMHDLQQFFGGGMRVVFQKKAEHAKEVKESVEKHEGCRLYGRMHVQRVAGNFHISAHAEDYETLQHAFGAVNKINISHTITHLSFGAGYPGLVNPLDGVMRSGSDDEFHYEQSEKEKTTDEVEKKKEQNKNNKNGNQQKQQRRMNRLNDLTWDENGGGVYKYFLKLVPTFYRTRRSMLLGLFSWTKSVSTNQFSVTEYFRKNDAWSGALPAVYFLYDFSPIAVTIDTKRAHVIYFLTRLCAVCGGVFACARMVSNLFDTFFSFFISLRKKK
jgi:endoplasmic reticulum-Golgi intermediate compartment protein 3